MARFVLRTPRAYWIAALLAIAVASPSLFAEFYCDDGYAVLRLEGAVASPVPGPLHLYTFARFLPGEPRPWVEHGPFPWWTSEGLKLSFFRPLSSALFAFDHWVAGRHPLPYHVHTIGWYAAAVVLAAMLFRHLLPEREGDLAALLFAVSPAHWIIAAWPSARHVAVSGAFALAAVLLHLVGRERGDVRTRFAAPLVWIVALSGGETALGALAYVAAYEVLGRSEALADRARALAPWGALLSIYIATYKGLGFGASEAGGYLDPLGEPRAYLLALPSRLAVFANAALLGIPSELTMIAPRLVPLFATLGVGALLLFLGLLRRARADMPPGLSRTLRWLLVGALFATIPGAAGIPGDRVLFLPNLGIVAALAVVLLRGAKKGRGSTGSLLLARAGVGLFGLVHVVLGPLAFAFEGWNLSSSSRAAMTAAAEAQIPRGDGVRLLGIGLADPLVGMYLGSSLRLAPNADPRPVELNLLSMSAHNHRVARIDDRTLDISIEGGSLLESGFESVVRSTGSPLVAGDVVSLGSWSVRVLADDGRRPTRFLVHFDRSLDDPRMALVVWSGGALRTLPPPRVGDSVLVRHEPGPTGI
jgi:hypothetical protein